MVKDDSDIVISGAAENNLKNIDVRIPLNQITCVTGKSGSGKSSLVDQIVAKESQRLQRITAGTASEYDKYVRPDFQHIKNLPNAVAIKQAEATRTDSSSVATYSGLNDRLRKLFVTEGQIVCHCGHTVDNTVDKDKLTLVLEQRLGDETYLFYSLISKNKPIDIGLFKRFCADYAVDRFIVDGKDKLFDVKGLSKLNKQKRFTVRALIGNSDKSNLSDLNLARFPIQSLQVYHAETCLINFKHHAFCYHCYSLYQSKSISLFTRKQLSRHSGACLTCAGKGDQKVINYASLINAERLITDLEFLNLANNGKAYKYINLQNSYLPRFAKENRIDTGTSFGKMKKSEQEEILGFLTDRLEKYLNHDKLKAFIIDKTCADCQGSGFSHDALSVFYRNKTIFDVLNLTLAEALVFFAETELQPILDALNKLALGHLALDRATPTLSGGELQRLKLVEVIIQRSEPLLLIIDEPSVGLHRNDLHNLFSLFNELVAQGNTLLIVDHHPWVIANSDNQIAIGPSSGAQGGRLVAAQKPVTETRQPWGKESNQQAFSEVTFTDISHHNIHRQSVDLPLHQLVCLVGVSGSGKSSLVQYIAENSQNIFDDVISLNQFSIGKNKRSTIATYLGIADSLRAIYAATEQSLFLDLGKSDFSSNSRAGACKVCAGLGEFNHMPCYGCNGQKLNPFILSITIDEKNISESLQVPIEEFETAIPSLFIHKKLHKALKTLIELGLGHLTLGREIPSISGGEAQRVKLAKYLVQNNNAITNAKVHNLLILDEPSQGLNSADSLSVLRLLQQLVGYHNSLLIVEHNEVLIRQSDYVIELGPQAGHLGGEITFAGQAEAYFNRSSKLDTKYEIVPDNAVEPTSVVEPIELYPSALANNQVDTTYFDKLEQLYTSYRLLTQEPEVVYFSNKKQMYQHYLAHFSTKPLYFNPFSSLFINSPFISRDDIERTLLSLKNFMFQEVNIAGSAVSLSQASKQIDNSNCWNVLVEAKDFNQAFELGSGWVVTESKGGFYNFSVPMLSLQEKIFATKAVSKNSFNLFYNKCPYCDGQGEVELSEGMIADPKLSILDVNFYKSELASVIKAKLLRKLKLTVSTFKQQKLFDFYKPFAEFTGQELTIYQQGFPAHQFVKKGGRVSAKGDIIAWSGMTRFLLDNIKYFPAQGKQLLLDSLTRQQCSACGGSRYNHRLNYYFTQMHKEGRSQNV